MSCADLSGFSRRAMGGLTAQDSVTVSLAGPARERWRAVGVKALDRLQAPGLTLPALLLGPDDGLPVRCQDQASTGVGHLDAVAAGLVDVEKEGLLDRVLVRSRFDEHAVLEEAVGRAQAVLTAVERESDV